MSRKYDVLVIGGGNAALCAAISARRAGASVLVLEGAPKFYRGGNTRHTRNMPDQRTPRQIDVEKLLAAAPAARDAVSVSVPAAAPAIFPVAEASDDGQGWMATWLGVLLLALGLVSVLIASRPLREAVLSRD